MQLCQYHFKSSTGLFKYSKTCFATLALLYTTYHCSCTAHLSVAVLVQVGHHTWVPLCEPTPMSWWLLRFE